MSITNPDYPGSTVLDLSNLPSLIETYVSRTTPDSLPLIRKAFIIYLKSLYRASSTESNPVLTDYISLLDACYDPYRIHLLTDLYSPLAAQFTDFMEQYLLVYSHIRKDLNLFLATGLQFFGDDISINIVYGDTYSVDPVTTLDPLGRDVATDEHFTTDMQPASASNSLQRLIALISYPYTRTNFSWSDFITKVHRFADFISLICPARLFFGINLVPELVYSVEFATSTQALDTSTTDTLDMDLKTDYTEIGAISVFGFVVQSSPYNFPDQVALLESLTDSQLASVYNYVVTDPTDATVTVLKNDSRTKTFLISSSQVISRFTLQHSADITTDQTPFTFLLLDQSQYPQIMTLGVKYTRIKIVFP